MIAVKDVRTRFGNDSDAASFIALIDAAWLEYTGVSLDLDSEIPEWRRLASYYEAKGGNIWAAEADGEVVGMVAVAPHFTNAWEISRMYVARTWRGTGLSHRLMDLIEEKVRASGGNRLVLWSDTRFPSGHRFYEKRSYVRAGPPKILDNPSRSLDFPYMKPLNGLVIEVLDATAAFSAERQLGNLLRTSVAAGADGQFREQFDEKRACQVWREVSQSIAIGKRLLLLAWFDGVIVGSAEIDLATGETNSEVSRLERVLVAPQWQDKEVGPALIAYAEAATKALGRRLLVAMTRSGDTLDHLLRDSGWELGAVMPDVTSEHNGAPAAQRILWRRVE